MSLEEHVQGRLHYWKVRTMLTSARHPPSSLKILREGDY